MAFCLQQVATSAVAPKAALSSSPQSFSLRSSLNASPISQPWWRDLSKMLKLECSASRKSQTRNRSSFLVRASESESAEPPAEAEVEAETEAETQAEPAPKKRVKDIMKILDAEARANALKDKQIPNLRSGDVVSLRLEVPENKRRISVLKGIVISRNGAGVNSTFRIRRIMAGVGVEMVFPLYSPNLKEIKVIDKRRARRAKLYYLRNKIARLSTVN